MCIRDSACHCSGSLPGCTAARGGTRPPCDRWPSVHHALAALVPGCPASREERTAWRDDARAGPAARPPRGTRVDLGRLRPPNFRPPIASLFTFHLRNLQPAPSRSRRTNTTGSVVQLRRYVKTVRPARAEAFLRLQTLPGEQAQIDWGHFGKIRIGSALRTLWCFVFVLSWSRAMFAHFMLDATLEAFMSGHALAFQALGGVPREILYDNLKSVVLERVGDHIRFHPRILDLAGYYCFAPKPCAPRRTRRGGS